uniref:Uncharacterized protein n=1 Tax=Anguilla anguilla TaxID=7936 RepID=A0A0E9PRU8_ANGAN
MSLKVYCMLIFLLCTSAVDLVTAAPQH